MSVFHCFTQYRPADMDTIRRNTIAQGTWVKVPWSEIPVPLDRLPRLMTAERGHFPYVRDVFDYACRNIGADDIVVYTNADIHCREDCASQVQLALAQSDACYAYRRDFGKLTKPLEIDEYVHGGLYPGSDLAGFRVRWWNANRLKFPDLLIGLEAWDPCFRRLADMTNHGKPTQIRDVIGHERHNSFWENPANRWRYPGQRYNRALAAKWLRANGDNPARHGI